MLTLAERREAWIDDLENGEHKQGSGALHNRIEGAGGVSESEHFCCLGRGCVLAMTLDFGIKVTVRDGYGELDYACTRPDGSIDSDSYFMPECVWEALGLDGEQGKRVRGEDEFLDEEGLEHDATSLDVANDDDMSFKEIAKLLRSGDYWIENKKGPSEA